MLTIAGGILLAVFVLAHREGIAGVFGVLILVALFLAYGAGPINWLVATIGP